MKALLSIASTFIALFFLCINNAAGCSVVRVSKLDPTTEVVQGSAIIVRAQAVGYVDPPENRTGIVRFTVIDALRGQLLRSDATW